MRLHFKKPRLKKILLKSQQEMSFRINKQLATNFYSNHSYIMENKKKN